MHRTFFLPQRQRVLVNDNRMKEAVWCNLLAENLWRCDGIGQDKDGKQCMYFHVFFPNNNMGDFVSFYFHTSIIVLSLSTTLSLRCRHTFSFSNIREKIDAYIVSQLMSKKWTLVQGGHSSSGVKQPVTIGSVTHCGLHHFFFLGGCNYNNLMEDRAQFIASQPNCSKSYFHEIILFGG